MREANKMDWTNSFKKSGLFILRFLLVVLLIAIAFAVGAMFGYSILGDGGDPLDIFNRELWGHIFSFVFN